MSKPRTTALLACGAALTTVLVTAPASYAAEGDVATFGTNSYGQLGNGPVSTTARPNPTNVLAGAADVAGGREHALAVVNGRVWAWGADIKGAVGDGGSFSSAVTAPTQLTSAVSGVDAVTTGHYHSMALDRDGDAVWSWGWNNRGQMGPNGGTRLKVAAPVGVPLPAGQVSMVAAGRAHSLALVGGQVYAWGDNGMGQLGRTPNTNRNPTPTLVGGLPAGVDWIAGGRDSSFAVADGVLYAWGRNTYGQLGDGTTTTRSTPQQVLTNVAEVESGADHTVALLTNGSVRAWGRNNYGQLGSSGATRRLTPTSVPGLSGITQVRVGRDHSIAIGGGKFYTWGRNDGGQLGRSGTTGVATAVPALAGATDAGAGQVFTVALR
jgi:alpha-tubulin suppressor-like RCC1 family protein